MDLPLILSVFTVGILIKGIHVNFNKRYLRGKKECIAQRYEQFTIDNNPNLAKGLLEEVCFKKARDVITPGFHFANLFILQTIFNQRVFFFR